MDDKTVLFSLKEGHLNMHQRMEKKIWPHPPLLMSTLVRVIVQHSDSGDTQLNSK